MNKQPRPIEYTYVSDAGSVALRVAVATLAFFAVLRHVADIQGPRRVLVGVKCQQARVTRRHASPVEQPIVRTAPAVTVVRTPASVGIRALRRTRPGLGA